MTATRKAVTVIALLAVLNLGVFAAKAAAIRPQAAHGHHHITWVSYTYRERGHDNAGDRYWRTCHVPAHRHRWCGRWRSAS